MMDNVGEQDNHFKWRAGTLAWTRDMSTYGIHLSVGVRLYPNVHHFIGQLRAFQSMRS